MINQLIADATDNDGNIDYAKLNLTPLSILARNDAKARAQMLHDLADPQTWVGVDDEERE